MSRGIIGLALVLVALLVVGLAVLLRRELVTRSSVVITAEPTTNSWCILHLTNAGASTARIYPLYSIEEPSQPAHEWRSIGWSAPVLPKVLPPGAACNATTPLPQLPRGPWRVAVWCESVRPAWKDLLRNWLIRVGLRERDKTAFIEYSPWLNTNSLPTPTHGP